MLIPANRVESTLAVAFVQGVSTEITLASVANCPAKSVAHMDDGVEWCLVKYASVDVPNKELETLTNPLAVYESASANGHEFPIGTKVCIAAAADLVEQLLLKSATDKTISGGVISVDSTRRVAAYLVDTEGGIPSDPLDTINGGAEGMLILLRAKDAAHTVVVKHGTGNLLTAGSDISLDDTYLYILLAYDTALTKWVVVGGGGGAQTPWASHIDAAGYNLTDLGGGSYFKFVGTDTVVRGWKPRAGQCTRANIDIYVRIDGNDANDGSANDSGHALLTIQKAADLIPDLIAHTVEVHVADGVYEETVTIRNKHLVTPIASITFTGNTTTPANCNIAGDTGGNNTPARRHCLVITDCTEITVNGVKCDYGGADTGSLGMRANVYVRSSTVRFKNFESQNSGYAGCAFEMSIIYLGDYGAATNPVTVTANTNWYGIDTTRSYTRGGAIDCGHNKYGLNAYNSIVLLEGDGSNDIHLDSSTTGDGCVATYLSIIRLRYVEVGDNAANGIFAELGSVVYTTYTNIASGANTGDDLAVLNHGMIRHTNDDAVLSESIDSVDHDDIW